MLSSVDGDAKRYTGLPLSLSLCTSIQKNTIHFIFQHILYHCIAHRNKYMVARKIIKYYKQKKNMQKARMGAFCMKIHTESALALFVWCAFRVRF